MNEIKEIMNGNIEIFNMRIEGETIAFDTPYNSNWNFMPRDFEQIIDTLQQENARLKDKIDKAIEYIERNKFDYEVKERGFYMIQGVVPEFRLREFLKGQLKIEEFERLLNGGKNE